MEKIPVKVNFSQGKNTKLDPWQLPPTNFQSLNNVTFTSIGQTTKRNGYAQLGTLGANNYNQLGTLNGGLVASGNNIAPYSVGAGAFKTVGAQLTSTFAQPVSLMKVPQAAGNSNLPCSSDVAFSGGLVCAAWGISSYALASYQIYDASSGLPLTGIVTLPAGTDTHTYAPRVFAIGSYFVVAFAIGTPYTIQYISIPVATPTIPAAAVSLATDMFAGRAYDAQVYNGKIYFSYLSTGTGNTILNTFTLDSALSQSASTAATLPKASSSSLPVVSVIADQSSPNNIWVLSSTVNGGNSYLYCTVLSSVLASVLAPTQVATAAFAGASTGLSQFTGVVKSNVLNIFAQTNSYYSFASSIAFGTIAKYTVTAAGSVVSVGVIQRGVILSSRAFLYNGAAYLTVFYQSNTQPTYFIIDESANIIAKFSPGGAGFQNNISTIVLSSVYLSGNQISFPYLIDYNIQPVQGNITNQVGINLGILTFNTASGLSDIAQSLHIAGSMLNQFDQAELVEHGFCVYPETVGLSITSAGASPILFQYIAVYEWTDAQGILHQSSPSIAQSISFTPTTGTLTISAPNLRLTKKQAVTTVIYQWSTTQPVFLRLTSWFGGTTSDSSSQSIAGTNGVDSAITGNQVLYTTGGVVDNIQAPASFDPIIFDDRMWITTSEQPDLFWLSKQVIQNVPVEFSDQLTYFVAPTQAGGSGPIYCKFRMDEKLILFRSKAISYLYGTGPDNTGANSSYSEPTEIVSPVGCSNRNSLLLIPDGILFQASNGGGIWLLGRDMHVSYKGSPEAIYNSASVLSAVLVPGTTQARFHLDNGIIIMFDYFADQWGDFQSASGNMGSVSTIYNGLHTYLDSNGQVQQETPGTYLDQANPVLQSFTPGWIALAGLQGYQRAYFFMILAKYISAHAIQIQVAYDYDPTIVQTVTITPTSNIPEQWLVHLIRQTCESFQITITEVYTGTNGAGFTMSGLNILAGVKKASRSIPGAATAG